MSLRKIWLFLILLWPFQPARAAQIPPTPDCRQSYQPHADKGPQPEAALHDADSLEDKIARLGPIPKRIMPTRYVEMHEALAAYCETGVPLVATDGSRYYPAGLGDDLGIYYFIPRFAVLAHLKLPKAIRLFFEAPLIFSMLIGIAFLLPSLENWKLKVWAILSLLVMTYSALRRGDVYTFQTIAVLFIVPWSLHLERKKNVGSGSAIFMAGAGVVIGFANLIRSQAATGVAIFLIVLIALHGHWAPKQKLALLVALIAGFVAPAVYFHGLQSRRDAFLAAVQPDSIRLLDRHPFWHSVYLGFSFVPNKYVPGYQDELVSEKVRSVAPSVGYLSPEYERIVRTEVFRLIRDHPLFSLVTMLAKLGSIGFLLLLSSNVGLLASALYPKPWPMEVAFWSAMGFNSLFGFVVIPHRQYLMGFTAFAVLYGIISIGYALECYRGAKNHTPATSPFASVTDRDAEG
jgi:hypothetical protein